MLPLWTLEWSAFDDIIELDPRFSFTRSTIRWPLAAFDMTDKEPTITNIRDDLC